MTMNKKASLPPSWAEVKLGAFVQSEKGKKPKSELKEKSNSHCLPYVDIQTFEVGVVNSWTDGTGCRLCYESDFLMVWDGSRSGLVGKGVNGALGSTLVRINFPYMVNAYAFYFLQSKYQQINTRAKGSGTPHVDPDLLWNYDFPIPPLNEQHRIVAKIEELFSDLDNGIESLKTAQAQLKVYRQAILKHAFDGKLTAQWRLDQGNECERADVLLNRIQKKKSQQYQQQLKTWQISEKTEKKPRPLQTVLPLTDQELSALPALPDEWIWVKFGQIFSVHVGATPSRSKPDYWDGSIPWLSSGEVAFCRIKDTKEKISYLGFKNASTELHPIGTVMLAMIGEGKTRGQAAILDVEACHNQNTAAIRVSESECSAEYVYSYLAYQYETTRKIGSGNNQKALNKERVSELHLPLCSQQEMVEITQRFDEKLSNAEYLDLSITTALQHSQTLRHSILEKAFSGQLVQQDSNDEPASVLLSRIQAEKTAQSSSKKASK